jgi:hypothetical protein
MIDRAELRATVLPIGAAFLAIVVAVGLGCVFAAAMMTFDDTAVTVAAAVAP